MSTRGGDIRQLKLISEALDEAKTSDIPVAQILAAKRAKLAAEMQPIRRTAYMQPTPREKFDSSKTTNGGVPFIYEIDGKVTIKEIAALAERVEGTHFTEKQWEDEIGQPYRTVSVRTKNRGTLVAYVRANMDSEDPELCHVEDAMIRPQYQGRGIFRRMVDMGLKQLEEDGFREVHFRNNPGTEGMYQHLGFLANTDGSGYHYDLTQSQHTSVK